MTAIDARLDRWVRFVLVAGMVISVSVMVLGLLLSAASPNALELTDLPLDRIPEAILEGNPVAVIDLGIVLLIATPFTRVLVSLVAFTLDREPRFVVAGLLVLLILGIAVALR